MPLKIKVPSCFQKTLKNSQENPSFPGLRLFFMFLRAIDNSVKVNSPSRLSDSFLFNFGMLCSLKISFKLMSVRSSSLLLYNFS